MTITIGGKPPTYVTPNSPSDGIFGRLGPSPLQTAIDHAAPGDLLIVGPGTYRENLLMWKPVRLQGVGAYSVTINADAHPAGKMDAWRRQVNCLFGLTDQGRPATAAVRRLRQHDARPRRPHAVRRHRRLGHDRNGNLAQQLQEPTLDGRL